MHHDRSAAQAGGEGTSILKTTTASFVELRELLFSAVYNLLGTVSDTEDVLQPNELRGSASLPGGASLLWESLRAPYRWGVAR